MKCYPAARAISVLSMLAISGLFLSCGGGSVPHGEGNPAKLTQINITPSNPSVMKGATLQLTATGIFDDHTQHALAASVTWQTSQSAVATIDAHGGVTGVNEGIAQMSAAFQGVSGSTSVTVGPPALLSITVSPNQSSLPIGESAQLTATGNFSDGSVQDLTQSATWSSSGPAIASVSPSGAVVANAVGTATMSATSGSMTGSASLTVTPPAIIALNIVPATLSMALGSSRQLQATARLSDGTTQALSGSATWQTSQSAVATVDTQGNVTGVGVGGAQVSAAYQGVTGTASVTVGPPVVVSITVSPNQSSLPIGESEQLTATGKLSDGTVQNLTQSATWSSSGSAIASVGPAGAAVANAVGTTTISATSGSLTGSASLTVTPPAVIALNIMPATFSMVLDSSRQLQAIATLSDGTTQDMTRTASWSSVQPSIANVNSRGVAFAMQAGSTSILAQANGLTGSADLTVMPPLNVSYFSLVNAVNAGVDGTIRLTNPGLTNGDLCAMVYVFDQNQELNECCGCMVSDSGLLTLSLVTDLTANTLTGKQPRAGEIMVVPSDPAQNPQCDPASSVPAGAIHAWATNAQVSGSTSQFTEAAFAEVPLTNGEETMLVNLCSFVKKLGSGKGICSCGTGD